MQSGEESSSSGRFNPVGRLQQSTKSSAALLNMSHRVANGQ